MTTQAQIDTLKADMQALADAINALQPDPVPNPLQIALDAANATIAAQQAELDAANSTIATLQSSLDAANGQVSQLQGQVDTLGTNVSTLQAKIDAARQAVQAEADADAAEDTARAAVLAHLT
jgi:predicted  nucleic acid-binding Zn-ribbon protein